MSRRSSPLVRQQRAPLPGIALGLAQNLQQALARYGKGEWDEAERLCRAILEKHPEQFDALNLLGIIAAQTRRTREAADLLGRAVACKRADAAAHNNYGNVLRDLQRYEEAACSYERAFTMQPAHAEAMHNHAITLRELRNPQEALRSLERALTVRPDFVAAHNSQGVLLQELGRLEEAVCSFDRAIAIKADYAIAHNNRGVALHHLKRFAAALESFERALALKPDYAEAHHNRGHALRELARLDEALESFERALQLNPQYAEAHNSRGAARQRLRRLDEALEDYEHALALKPDYADAHHNRASTLYELGLLERALDSYERALAARPDYPDALYGRGNALRDLGYPERALDSYEQALALKPDHAESHFNRGSVLRDLKRFDAARGAYEQALALKPDLPWLYGAAILAQVHVCDWRDLDTRIAGLCSAIGWEERVATPFTLIPLLDSAATQRRAAQIWVRDTCPESRALPPIDRGARQPRIRIGYYSADYHQHATANLAAELFERHDRDRFEIVAFSFGPARHDAMTERLAAAFDRFIDVRTRSDREIAQLSRHLQIDIAVDLKGFTQHQRTAIFAHRAAPIQVNYLGYPGTMGAPYIDYLVADPTLIPAESRPHYTEKIAYLPNSYQVNDRKRPIAPTVPSRVQLGLPPQGFVFCCFNNPYKITAQIFDSWMRILREVDSSVLWLLEDGELASDNLRKAAQERGVDDARLVFARRAPLPEHLARHQAADLFIDTLPCNAHTTASDALWAGLPLLTCAGESFASRVSASLLNAVGLPQLICTTRAQYEQRAIELARTPERLAQIRATLRANRLSAPLFDTERFTRHLEEAYRQMYERYHSGLAPDHIHVAG